MGDLSPHFDRREFRCNCGHCGFDTVDHELITILEALHDHYNSAVKINSGCRCYAQNAIEGGAPSSQHLRGKAADIVVAGIGADAVADYLETTYASHYGIGRYRGRTHIDCRPEKARWDFRKELTHE